MQLIIFGGGRWAQEICKEAIKFKSIKKIILITNNNKIKFRFNKLANRIFFYKYFSFKILTKKSKIIICNSAHDHFKVLKRIKNLNNDILIEKPLFTKTKHIKYLTLKKNIFFS